MLFQPKERIAYDCVIVLWELLLRHNNAKS